MQFRFDSVFVEDKIFKMSNAAVGLACLRFDSGTGGSRPDLLTKRLFVFLLYPSFTLSLIPRSTRVVFVGLLATPLTLLTARVVYLVSLHYAYVDEFLEPSIGVRVPSSVVSPRSWFPRFSGFLTNLAGLQLAGLAWLE